MTYRQVQMMSGHRDPKTVMRYDHGREHLDTNTVNLISSEEEPWRLWGLSAPISKDNGDEQRK